MHSLPRSGAGDNFNNKPGGYSMRIPVSGNVVARASRPCVETLAKACGKQKLTGETPVPLPEPAHPQLLRKLGCNKARCALFFAYEGEATCARISATTPATFTPRYFSSGRTMNRCAKTFLAMAFTCSTETKSFPSIADMAWAARNNPSEPRGLAPSSNAGCSRVARTIFKMQSHASGGTCTPRTASCDFKIPSGVVTGWSV